MRQLHKLKKKTPLIHDENEIIVTLTEEQSEIIKKYFNKILAPENKTDGKTQ